MISVLVSVFFFFNDTATTEIYTLSLHDALPICANEGCISVCGLFLQNLIEEIRCAIQRASLRENAAEFHFVDRKSTRLNSSHSQISYAVFCLKKKKKKEADLMKR